MGFSVCSFCGQPKYDYELHASEHNSKIKICTGCLKNLYDNQIEKELFEEDFLNDTYSDFIEDEGVELNLNTEDIITIGN